MTRDEAIAVALAHLEREYSIYLTPEMASFFGNEQEVCEENRNLFGKWIVWFPPSWELPELGKPEIIVLLVDDGDGTVEMESGPGKPYE